MNSSLKIAAVAAATLTLLLAAVFAIRGIGNAPRALQRATVLPTPMPLPDFQLVDQDGAPFTRDSLRDRQTLLFFGFTHCPDICPATLQQLALARNELVGRLPQDVAPPDILLISVDPDRDTPEVLKVYTAIFGPGAYGATGELDKLLALTSTLGIFFETGEANDSGYTVNHSAAVLLVNDRAELQAVFSAPHDVGSFVSDLLLLTDVS
jgi:protein SCO1/2